MRKMITPLLAAAAIPTLLVVHIDGQIQWNQPNADVITAQGYTYTMYVTPFGQPMPTGALVLTQVTCSATTPPTSPPTAFCSAPSQQVAGIGGLTYGASDQLTATDSTHAESEKSAPYVYGAVCIDSAGKPLVNITVGTWTNPIVTQGTGQVLYSMLQSKSSVTQVSVKFNGAQQGIMSGVSLNNAAGSYFVASAPPGMYQLTVEAQDANGCKAGGDARPMTVTVTQ
jgi:hypothetical protein